MQENSLSEENQIQPDFIFVEKIKREFDKDIKNYLNREKNLRQQDKKQEEDDFCSLVSKKEYLVQLKCADTIIDQENQQDILEVVNQFLKPDFSINNNMLSKQPRHLVIFGDSGCGKTTLAFKIFDKLLEEDQIVPIFISLCNSQEQNPIQAKHKEVRFRKIAQKINGMNDSEVIFILDGYDELQQQAKIVESIFTDYPKIISQHLDISKSFSRRIINNCFLLKQMANNMMNISKSFTFNLSIII